MSDTVTRDDAGGVATLTLQRPGLSHALRTDLLAAVQAVAADESVRAVLITGTGRAFCVGPGPRRAPGVAEGQRGDVAERRGRGVQPADPGAVRAAGAGRRRHQRRLRRGRAGSSRSPVTCGSPRPARSSRPPSPGSALSSDSALASRLVHSVGGSRAAQLLLTPDPFTAETARAVGAGAPRRPGRGGAGRGAGAGRAAGRGPDRRLPGGQDRPRDGGHRLARGHAGARGAAADASSGQTADHLEAVTAFLEKRAPEFTGR